MQERAIKWERTGWWLTTRSSSGCLRKIKGKGLIKKRHEVGWASSLLLCLLPSTQLRTIQFCLHPALVILKYGKNRHYQKQIRKTLTIKTFIIPFCWGVTRQDRVLYLQDKWGGGIFFKERRLYHASEASHFIKPKLELAKKAEKLSIRSLILWPGGSIQIENSATLLHC